MKQFIKYFLLFTLPILILGLFTEFLLRKIPNDYIQKKEFLDKNSDSVEVLFLGNSHSFYGVNPTYFSSNSFNASHVSQSLDYDFEILKKYNNHWRKLKCIAIPISCFSLFGRLETGPESWREKNYTIYYKITASDKFIDYSEAIGNKLNVVLRRLNSYYILGKSNISSSNLGWGIDFNSNKKMDLKLTGEIAAKKHTMKNDKCFIENLNILKSIIAFAKINGVNILFYTPPAYHTYSDNLDSNQINQTIKAIVEVDQINDNVSYHNFLFDSSFSEIDFYDADHLNEIGAKKFTGKLDTLINQEKQSLWH